MIRERRRDDGFERRVERGGGGVGDMEVRMVGGGRWVVVNEIGKRRSVGS